MRTSQGIDSGLLPPRLVKHYVEIKNPAIADGVKCVDEDFGGIDDQITDTYPLWVCCSQPFILKAEFFVRAIIEPVVDSGIVVMEVVQGGGRHV